MNKLLPSIIILVSLPLSSHAITYSTPAGNAGLNLSPDEYGYIGQTFTIDESHFLNSMTFYQTSATPGAFDFYISAFSNDAAVGSHLYESTVAYEGSGSRTIIIPGINISLSSGTYIAYFSGYAIGTDAFLDNVFQGGSTAQNELPGNFRYINTATLASNVDYIQRIHPDPITTGQGWSQYPNLSFAYSATFDESPLIPAIPEPKPYAMFLSGLGTLGFLAARQMKRPA